MDTTREARSYHPKFLGEVAPGLGPCCGGPILIFPRAEGTCPPCAHPAPSAHALATEDLRIPYLDYAEPPSRNCMWAFSPALSFRRLMGPQECASLGPRPGHRAAICMGCGLRVARRLGCLYLCP